MRSGLKPSRDPGAGLAGGLVTVGFAPVTGSTWLDAAQNYFSRRRLEMAGKIGVAGRVRVR